MTAEERARVGLRLDQAVQVWLLEEAGPTSGRAFRNLEAEEEKALVTQDYSGPPVEDDIPVPALTGEQERVLHRIMASRRRSFVHYAPEDGFASSFRLDAQLETAWEKAPGPTTINVVVSDLSIDEQMRIWERVTAWNDANSGVRVLEDRIKMRMEFRLFYLLTHGTRVLTPGT